MSAVCSCNFKHSINPVHYTITFQCSIIIVNIKLYSCNILYQSDIMEVQFSSLCVTNKVDLQPRLS
jgi:hypothetical protein